jgi:hypothetical protein
MSELVRRLAWLDTTAVSDALEGLGLPSGIGGLRAQWGGPRLAGVARTVELEPDPGDTPGPHIATRAIAPTFPAGAACCRWGARAGDWPGS